MAEKLFYEDVGLAQFDAQVVCCQPEGGAFAVVLDRTAFYPEGGGQPGDTGTLGGARVLDTQERGGEIIHLCASPLAPGSCIRGAVDWARRFDFMQQHTGEHIVSGLACRRTGAQNVGFHMGAQTVTVDLSRPIGWEELLEIEREANEIVWRNERVLERYPTEEELKTLEFRSKKELHGWVRLIEIPGADLCACCGLHVAATGAVGLIQILSVQKFHEGVRLEMVSGRRAYEYARMNAQQNRAVSGLLSVPLPETASGVQRLQADRAELSYRLTGLEQERLRSLAGQAAGQDPALLLVPGLDAAGVRRLCTELQERAPGVAAVFSGADGEGYKYACARLPAEQLKEMNAALSGRGGGKPGFAQGTVTGSEAEIRAWFAALGQKN